MADTLTTRNGCSAAEMYSLLEEQVKAYHRHYHMGQNTSVAAQTAQELLASIRYTLETAGPDSTPSQALHRGQAILTGRLEEAKRRYALVAATQSFQDSWFWEDMGEMGRYLDRYDPLFFAHRGPELLCYPIAMTMPAQLQGIEEALYYLNCLWLENQILGSFPEGVLEEFLDALPGTQWDGPQMLCQMPLLQAVGRILLELPLDTLLLGQLRYRLPQLSREAVLQAGEQVCAALKLTPGAAVYAQAVLRDVLPRLLSSKAPAGMFV